MATVREHDVSTSSLIGGLLDDVRELCRDEVALARAEIREELKQARTAGTALAIAVVTAGLGALWLMVALTRGIADTFNWPVWAGYAIVGVPLVVIGAALLHRGRRQMQGLRKLPRTSETIRSHVKWAAGRSDGTAADPPQRTADERRYMDSESIQQQIDNRRRGIAQKLATLDARARDAKEAASRWLPVAAIAGGIIEWWRRSRASEGRGSSRHHQADRTP